MKRLFFRIHVFLLALLLTPLFGCMYHYKPPLGEEQQVKQFEPVAGASTFYIYRSEGFAEQVQVPILLNGSAVAQTSARTFFVLEVEPGVHTLVSQTRDAPSLTLVTEPGENYFIWQELNVGLLSPRSKLHLVSAEKGQSQVMRCRLLKGYL